MNGLRQVIRLVVTDNPPTVSRRPVLAIFALTGASGLIYQVIWARRLGLVLGNTTASIAIVLSTFMAGLALGSWLAGRYLVGSGNPLRRYALFEGAIGAYAILFGPLAGAMEALYPALLADNASAAALLPLRAAAAFALLIVPTTLMGATLPLTTEYLHRLQEHHSDWNAGKLYAANTFGAAAGSFASGFILIELIGIDATNLIAAAFNFAVMAVGLRLAKNLPDREAPAGAAPDAPPAPATPEPLHLRYLLLFALTGALALAGEVVWSRALSLLLGNSTYAFSAMLVVYLTGIAGGSWLMSGQLRRFRDIRLLLPLSLAATALWYSLAVEIVGPLHMIAYRIRSVPGYGSGLLILLYFLGVLSLMAPGALLSGALFPVITRLIGGEGGDRGIPIARAYTWNTVGCIFGSLIGGFLIVPSFLQYHAVYVLALAAAALTVLAAPAAGGRRPAALALLLAAGAAAVSVWKLGSEDFWLSRYKALRPGIEVTYHQPGLQGVTSVVHARDRKERTQMVLVNGHGMTVKTFATKAMAHLPIALHGGAEDTLVICFGMGTSYRSALSYGGRVDVVELVPEVLDVFGQFYGDADEVRRNPSGRMIVNDGRNFLLVTPKRYDVITVDPPPPIDAAGVNNLYSQEFMELMRDRLKPGGIAAHWIPAPGRASGLYDQHTVHMLMGTFMRVFPEVRVFPHPHGWHLIGSMQPLAIDDARMDALFARPAVAADLNEYSWEPFDRQQLLKELPVTPELRRELMAISPVTDSEPYLEFNLIRNLLAGRWQYMFRASP